MNSTGNFSNVSNSFFISNPPLKPVSFPSFPITRWQGIVIRSGLAAIAEATARTAVGF